VSATADGGTDSSGPANRLGFKAGMVVQELGWDQDTDDQLRISIEDAIDGDMVDSDHGNVVEAVVLWWRDDDGDLVDALVDALTELTSTGYIWLMTPKVGRSGYVDAADLAEAVVTAGLAQTVSVSVSPDWAATKLVRPRNGRR
jgi:hypothetical protein